MASRFLSAHETRDSGRSPCQFRRVGFPLKMFRPHPDPKYLCILCSHVLRDAMQSYCSHRMCRTCLHDYTSTGGMCPACTVEEAHGRYSDLKSAFPDRAMQKELDKMEVICEHAPECDWRGRLHTYANHEIQCGYRPVACEFGCSAMISMQMIESHYKEEAPKHLEYLLQRCNEIEMLITENQNRDSDNQQIAELRSKLDSFNTIIQTIQEDMNQQTPRNVHITNPTPDYIPPTAVHTDQIHAVSRSLDSLEGTLNSLFVRVESSHRRMGEVGAESVTQQAAIGRLRHTVSSLEQNLHLKDATLLEIERRIKMAESSSHSGTYVYRIDQWQRKSQVARDGTTPSVYSPPFYTSTSGYKLCLRVYPHGDGMGRGSHFSVFFVIMRGPHDAVLSWPFRCKVTFTLLDQTGSEHITEAFRPDHTSTSFRKPLSDMNIASGCPMFAELRRLHGAKYIVDDVMFIKVSVAQN